MDTVIISGRRTGKTTDIIQLCHTMNLDARYNRTVIVVADANRARFVMGLAHHLGYGDIPMPVTIQQIINRDPRVRGAYTKVLIDDAEAVLQSLLGPYLTLEAISLSHS